MRLLFPAALFAYCALAPTGVRLGANDDIVVPKFTEKLTGAAKWLLPGPDYSGIVTDVTGRTMAIAHQGTRIQFYNAAGQKIGGEVIPPQPPVAFQAGNILADGGFSEALMAPYSYRWSDVKVGDRVSIRFEKVGGARNCTAIRIERRPGGRVPAAQLKEQDPFHKGIPQWHELANALQDFEEKGIPLPEKYRPKPLVEQMLHKVGKPPPIPPAKP